ncbi:phage major capsid protein [Streptomyces griseoaurantiacus]|uniref:Phage major capsid protein n=1 Tax=Streptomyces griseoaurantiacus TaxID=68213 RepID=A0A7W2DSP0_9ACTN|nr:phage major capsid protein [Streptomyces griseoaurantiacus]MBA5222229.1 phage major capsid protein [Streptomyces griseoaurantiacus]
MATRNTYEDWIPEEYSGPVITRVNQQSAVERLARRIPMATDTKHVPRSAGVGVNFVAKGNPYTEDASVNDDVLLTALKFGRVIRIADEDLKDTTQVANIIATKQNDWATSYAKFIDNATLATSAAGNGTTVPFTSLYYSLTQNDTDTSYTANANLTQTGSGGVTYDNLSATLADYEAGDFFDDGNTIVIASPVFKAAFRGIKDDEGRPIFVTGLAGTPDTLFNYPVAWSNGCRLSATATDTPTGSPVLFVGNREYLFLGIRSGPESMTAGADTGAAFLTDEALLKMRARRGFAVAHEKAWACLEDNS